MEQTKEVGIIRDSRGLFLKGSVGLEKRFKNADELLAAAEDYLVRIEQEKKTPTMAGLALALGFRSRQALLNYAKAPGYEDFHDALSYLRLRLEALLEERLIAPDCKNVVGLIFNMKNNYGYSDKQEISMESKNMNLTGFTLVDPNDQNYGG